MVELKPNKCMYCGQNYSCIEEYLQYRACPDCFPDYYILNISGEVIERDTKRAKNDVSYRNELQPVTHRGKYQNLGGDEE